MINCVSNSEEEPNEINKNLTNSLFEHLPCPSAIFEGIETTALLI